METTAHSVCAPLESCWQWLAVNLAALNTVPVAVYSAIILFLVKEALEWRRRKRADDRKIRVYKMVLAHECERIHWFVKSMKDKALHVRRAQGGYTVRSDESGRIRFVNMRTTVEEGSSSMLPNVHEAAFEKYAIEVAYLDEQFAQKVRAAVQAALTLKHIRASVIDYADPEYEYASDGFYSAFWSYVDRELEATFEQVADLYMACTGNVLSNFSLL